MKIVYLSYFGLFFGLSAIARPEDMSLVQSLMSLRNTQEWKTHHRQILEMAKAEEQCDLELEQKHPPAHCFQILGHSKQLIHSAQKMKFLHRNCLRLTIDDLLRSFRQQDQRVDRSRLVDLPEPCGSHLRRLVDLLMYQLEEKNPRRVWSELGSSR